MTTIYDVVFTPNDAVNWETAQASTTVKIDPLDASKATVTTPDVAYTGKEVTPDPVVKLGDTTLKAGTDYDITNLKDNKEVGKGTFDIVFKGNYTGKITGATFNIVKAQSETPKATTASNTGSTSKTGDTLPISLTVTLSLIALLSAGVLIGSRRFGRH